MRGIFGFVSVSVFREIDTQRELVYFLNGKSDSLSSGTGSGILGGGSGCPCACMTLGAMELLLRLREYIKVRLADMALLKVA